MDKFTDAYIGFSVLNHLVLLNDAHVFGIYRNDFVPFLINTNYAGKNVIMV